MMLSDDELMCRFQDGDETAFRRLLERYQDRIVNFTMKMVGDYDTASDLSQEVFIRVYTNAGRYLPGSKFAPWLYRIAANLSINEIRRRKRWRFFSIDEQLDEDHEPYSIDLPDETTPSPEDQILKREASHQVEAALKKIPVKYRMPLVLREIEGYDYEEISKILDVPRGTVKSRLNRGRALLKTALFRLDAGAKASAWHVMEEQ